jgi:hypothetical protein
MSDVITSLHRVVKVKVTKEYLLVRPIFVQDRADIC